MGKYIDFPSQQPYVRPKSAIYTPKRNDKHHFYMEGNSITVISSNLQHYLRCVHVRWDRSLCLYLNKMLNILPIWNWSSFPQSCTQISCWQNLFEACTFTSLVTFLTGDLHVRKHVHKFIWFDQISLLASLTRDLGTRLTHPQSD